MTFPALVVDASAALCLLLLERQGNEVEELIRETVERNGQIFVPYLFWDELYNGLLSATRRGRISKSGALESGRHFARLPFVSHDDTQLDVRERTLEIAAEHRLSYYDARYLELALRYGLRLKTFDDDLLRLRSTYRIIN